VELVISAGSQETVWEAITVVLRQTINAKQDAVDMLIIGVAQVATLSWALFAVYSAVAVSYLLYSEWWECAAFQEGDTILAVVIRIEKLRYASLENFISKMAKKLYSMTQIKCAIYLRANYHQQWINMVKFNNNNTLILIQHRWASQLVNHKQHMVWISSRTLDSLSIKLNLKASSHHHNIQVTIITQMQTSID